MYNNSTIIGNIGEALAIAEFSKRGFTVLIPFGQNVPYDIVVDINGKLYKIQCKTTEKVHEDGRMRFNICRTNGFTNSHKTYSNNEVDFIFLHCIENNFIGLISIDETDGKRDIFIRTKPTKNNQVNGIRIMQEYELDYKLGTLAQLVRATGS